MSTQKGDVVRQKHKRAEKVGANPCKSVKVLDKTCASVREVRVYSRRLEVRHVQV